jgi:AraC-like DNA-binding protein
MLARAVEGRVHLFGVGDGEKLLTLLQEIRPAALLTMLRDAQGRLTAPTIVSARARFPDVPIIGALSLEEVNGGDVLALAAAGVRELVLLGRDNIVVALERAIQTAARRPGLAAILAALPSEIPEAISAILRRCLEQFGRLSVPDLARLTGIHRRTLHKRLRRVGALPPHALIAWCRIMLAVQALEQSGQSVEQVAFTVGFSSASALWNMMRRYLGCGPQEIRARGGLGYVMQRFAAAAVGRAACARSVSQTDGDLTRPMTSGALPPRETSTRTLEGPWRDVGARHEVARHREFAILHVKAVEPL